MNVLRGGRGVGQDDERTSGGAIMSRQVTYSREMREHAREHKRGLATIAFGGIVWQSTVGSEDTKRLHELFRTFLSGRRKQAEDQA